MKKYLLILTCALAFFTSCEDTESAIYDDISLTYFTDGTSGKYYVQDDANSVYQIQVGVTDKSSVDRNYIIDIDEDNTTATNLEYSIDDVLFIPANSNVGTINIYGSYDDIVTGSTLSIDLVSIDNSNVATFDNNFSLTFFQFCPLVIDEFVGAWDADEEGYQVYDVNVTAGSLPNEIIISNVWDSDPNSTTSVYLDDSDPSNFVLDFPPYLDNYLYNNAQYGAAYIDNAYGTFDACNKVIDMYFQVRVSAGVFEETHITFTIQ